MEHLTESQRKLMVEEHREVHLIVYRDGLKAPGSDRLAYACRHDAVIQGWGHATATYWCSDRYDVGEMVNHLRAAQAKFGGNIRVWMVGCTASPEDLQGLGVRFLDPALCEPQSSESVHQERVDSNPDERIFAEAWTRNASVLDYLLDPNYLTDSEGRPVPASNRDRQVAATLMQWLGSVSGRDFLDDVLPRLSKRPDF